MSWGLLNTDDTEDGELVVLPCLDGSFVFSLKNPSNTGPKQIWPRAGHTNTACMYHETCGPLFGNGYDIGILGMYTFFKNSIHTLLLVQNMSTKKGHPQSIGPHAWSRLGLTYDTTTLPQLLNMGYFVNGPPMDFTMEDFEIFKLVPARRQTK